MSDKQYLVIGGSHGIGFDLTRLLGDSESQVTVVSRTVGRLDELPNVRHIQMDVTGDTLNTQEWPERIDGLAYLPGSIRLGSIRSLKPDELVEDFRLNAVGAVKCIQASLPGLKSAEQASIVMISTVAVSTGMPMHTSVAAAKGAVEGITRTLAAELAPNIRVNCIAPALTDTPLAERLLANEQKRAAMAEMYPLKRVGQPEDVASLAAFLLKDVSGWITGQVIGVDGGMSRLRK